MAIDGGVFSVFDATWESPVMASLVAQQTGIVLSDGNGDGIPDTEDQVRALLSVATEIGVPLDQVRPLLTADDVNIAVALDIDGADRTSFEISLVDTRNQESVAEARELLESFAREISDALGGTFVQTTGSPLVREASLAATNDALQVSLPIALVLCLTVATVFLRSLRYGLASVVPIVMVVAWLYAFMELAGYSINIVTATIAAVSVGIGIDFAIHFIARYREELARHGLRSTAVRAAGEGTGVALVASAFSSAIGFGILALAPMPLFAAYGLLTALMIGLALVATLVVLPSVLVLITRDRSPDELLALHAEGGEHEPDAPEDGDRSPELGAPSLV
jgi:predicted RND superfamily exporter protein